MFFKAPIVVALVIASTFAAQTAAADATSTIRRVMSDISHPHPAMRSVRHAPDATPDATLLMRDMLNNEHRPRRRPILINADLHAGGAGCQLPFGALLARDLASPHRRVGGCAAPFTLSLWGHSRHDAHQ